MRKTRILIIDDSVVIRLWLSGALSRQPNLEVVGSAPNGRTALLKIPLLHPDLVMLDIEMSEMNGLETLAAIRQTYPQLPVIMMSVSTELDAAATIDALALGASDYVVKPADAACSDPAQQTLNDELVAKVASYCLVDVSPSVVPAEPARPVVAPSESSEKRPAKRVDVVAIGVSTGGPNALMGLISRFPRDFPTPILIVQHMPPVFTKLLAERLARKCRIRVAEAGPLQELLPGTAWIAPGDFHMVVERDGERVRVRTHQDPPEHSCRPAADVLFRSVARVYGSRALAVVMTGMGRDGLGGCEQIHAAGGQVLVQDQASSVVWGMPGLIAKAGIADRVLPLDRLGPEIMSRVSRHRRELHVLVGE